ncbi:MAG: hypothetical protein RL227_552 [Pseudomonadota bacterium]|jgi:peptidoglycan/xylan/chitin deacetylase (PgdA/CDA1 family)
MKHDERRPTAAPAGPKQGLRLDRWLSLRVAPWLPGAWGGHRSAVIPILMYHAVSDEPGPARHPYFATVTTPRRFAQQLATLRRMGYRSIGLAEAARALQAPAEMSAKGVDTSRRVVLSFDDGFADFGRTAWPVLARAGFGATLFAVSGLLGGRFHDGRPLLSARDLRQLSDEGVEIGSHSATHGRLVAMSSSALRRELADSRQVLEDCCGRAVRVFSYPYRFPQGNARFVAQLAGLLQASGYEAGVTTAIGLARPGDPPLFLPRLPVNDFDDDPLLRAKLAGHYDWLRVAQALAGRARVLAQRHPAAGVPE